MRTTIIKGFITGLLVAVSLAAEHTVLLTGGTGFIGSHVAVELLQNGYQVILTDHKSSQRPSIPARIESASHKKISAVYPIEMLDEAEIDQIFNSHKIDAVIHLAGYKSVGESVSNPSKYYENNLISTLNLLKVMKKHDCDKLVFSSSATVYGSPKYVPIDEEHPVSAANPYGQTKLMIEQMLVDEANANKGAQFISLRYFNPIGAHESGHLGEDSKGVPANIFPYILDVVKGKRSQVNVFGNDYETKDGTAIRDYIHIMDLAEGHLKAVDYLFKSDDFRGHSVYNLGTGQGYTVLELIKAVSISTGKKVKYVFTSRRPGDIEKVYADSSKAKRDLGFVAKRSLSAMVEDGLNYIAIKSADVDL